MWSYPQIAYTSRLTPCQIQCTWLTLAHLNKSFSNHHLIIVVNFLKIWSLRTKKIHTSWLFKSYISLCKLNDGWTSARIWYIDWRDYYLNPIINLLLEGFIHCKEASSPKRGETCVPTLIRNIHYPLFFFIMWNLRVFFTIFRYTCFQCITHFFAMYYAFFQCITMY